MLMLCCLFIPRSKSSFCCLGQGIVLSPTNASGNAGSNVILTCTYPGVAVSLVTLNNQQAPNYTVIFKNLTMTQYSLNNVSKEDNNKQFICMYDSLTSSNITTLTVFCKLNYLLMYFYNFSNKGLVFICPCTSN